MALKPQLSFSSGELDPILHDRVTLERFQNALATARNVMIGKTGSVMSRFGTFNFKKTRYENNPVKIYCPPGSGLLLEFGVNPADDTDTYCDLYDFSGNLLHTYKTTLPPTGVGDSHLYFSKTNLQNLQFEYSKDYVYVFEGSGSLNPVLRLDLNPPYYALSGLQLITSVSWPVGPLAVNLTTSSTGYKIDYAVTILIDGRESDDVQILNSANPTAKKCINVGEESTLEFDIIAGATVPTSFQEIRVYQRPAEGSAYGYLGRTTNFYISGGRVKAKFVDIGADPDFSNGLQKEIVKDTLNSAYTAGIVFPGTGIVYQQRLILGNIRGINEEAIVASRPGLLDDFYRDFPYASDSALNFKAGSSGKAKVLRMIEHNGLVVFTTTGVFVSTGVLGPDNIVLDKRGSWIIDENIPPLLIPGGMFFVEAGTGAIKQLAFSQELSTYDSIDQSIFSSHLFKNKVIKSWAFQDGTAPLVIVTFYDGTFATFTYNYEHQMKAWTRGDSIYPIEQVEGTNEMDLSFFVINKNGTRYIEGTVPRYITPNVFIENPEAYLLTYGAFMDSMKIKVNLLNDSLSASDSFTLTPVTPNDWEGTLTLGCSYSNLFTNPGNGEVGTIFRFFNPKDKSKLDLEIISRTNDNTVIVQPSEEFPEEYASGFRLYLTHTIVTGLDHLEGELVSIIADGDVLSSPYNDNNEEAETFSVVQSGEMDLEVFHNYRSAITIVGRPIVADIKTLNISTAEQSPTMIESLTVNKLYLRIFESRGLYIDNQFPEEKVEDVDGTSVLDMQPIDEYYVPNNISVIGNRSKPKVSKRVEVTIPGSWEGNGQMAIRQVDPLHFEILSIIADIEVLKRSDR